MSTEKNNNHLYLGFFVLAVLAYLYYTRFFGRKNRTDIDDIIRGIRPKDATPDITSGAAPQNAAPIFYMKGSGVSKNDLFDLKCPDGYTDIGVDCAKSSAFSSEIITKGGELKSQDQLLYSKSSGSTIPDPGLGRREWAYKESLFYPKCPSDMIDLDNSCWPTSTRFYTRGNGVSQNTLYEKCPSGFTDLGMSCSNEFKTFNKKTIEQPYNISYGSNILDPGFGKREWAPIGARYYPKCPSGTQEFGKFCVYT